MLCWSVVTQYFHLSSYLPTCLSTSHETGQAHGMSQSIDTIETSTIAPIGVFSIELASKKTYYIHYIGGAVFAEVIFYRLVDATVAA